MAVSKGKSPTPKKKAPATKGKRPSLIHVNAPKPEPRKVEVAPDLSIDNVTIEEMEDWFMNGDPLILVAQRLKCTVAKVFRWIHHVDHPERSTRVRKAREYASSFWDDRGALMIETAKTPLDAQKARDLAHHYRWRAARLAPKMYGDKLQLTGDPENPVAMTFVDDISK